MLSNLEELPKYEVRVGFFDTMYGDDNDNHYVAQVAQWQEEGVKHDEKFTHPRPFFRQNFDQEVKSSKYRKPIGFMIDKVSKGISPVVKELTVMGQGLKLELGRILENGDMFAKNSDEWSEHKQKVYGSSTPLTYTGLMKDSVKFKVNKTGKND